MQKIRSLIKFIICQYGLIILCMAYVIYNMICKNLTDIIILFAVIFILIIGIIVLSLIFFVPIGNNLLLSRFSHIISSKPFRNNSKIIDDFMDDLQNIPMKCLNRDYIKVTTHEIVVKSLMKKLKESGYKVEYEYEMEPADKKKTAYNPIKLCRVTKDDHVYVLKFNKAKQRHLCPSLFKWNAFNEYYKQATGKKKIFYNIKIPCELLKSLHRNQKS